MTINNEQSWRALSLQVKAELEQCGDSSFRVGDIVKLEDDEDLLYSVILGCSCITDESQTDESGYCDRRYWEYTVQPLLEADRGLAFEESYREDELELVERAQA